MLQVLFKNEYIKLLTVHVIIGFLVYLFLPLSKLYFITFFLFFSYKIFISKPSEKHYYILLAASYAVGSEIFLRMTKGYFSYETGKYLVMFYCLLGCFFSNISKKTFSYVIYLMLLVPGIYIGLMNANFDTDIRKSILFNLSGPITLGFASIFCYGRVLFYSQLNKVLMYALLPLFSTVTYLFFYTPDLKEVITGTYSNFATSGGFGPNQVATMLGYGMFILTTRFFILSKSWFLKLLNGCMIGVFMYRGIVTFSRGGIITGFVIIIAFIFLYYRASSKAVKRKVYIFSFAFFSVVVLAWFFSSVQTMGFIDKRYLNEDGAGRKKEDVTTGRSHLISFELNEFMENPFLGIGVGKVKELRFEKEGLSAASHNEISRILAEHGFFGICAFIILLVIPLFYRNSNKRNIYFYSFYIFWFLTINHTSMRIAAPAFIYALSLLNVTYDKPIIHRQQALKK